MIDINNMDKTVTIMILYSKEKLIRTFHSIPWSIELNKRIQHVLYWRLVKYKFKTKISQHRRLYKIQSKLSSD